MRSNSLYIIGNGFDIHHGCQTKYSDFGEFLKSKNYQLYSAINDFIPVNSKWSNFESALGGLDIDYILEEAGEHLHSYANPDWSDSYHHSFQFDLSEKVKLLSEKLYEEFAIWIDIQNENIDKYKIKKSLNLNEKATYLSFNYTEVLEKIYGISDVLHIHGSAGESDLALGHAWECREDVLKSTDDDDIRIIEGYQIVNEYFGKTFKDCSDIILNHTSFFKKLQDINQVYILGHSLGEVDYPYFYEILKNVHRDTVWCCSAYLDEDWINIENSLKELGIKKFSIKAIKDINFV